LNAYLILVALLVLTYAGSALFRGRRIRGYGLPSGAEYLVLGIVVGPIGLAAVTKSTIAMFEPISVTAISWLSLLAGANLGFSGERSVASRRTAGGIALGMLCLVASGAAVWVLAPLIVGIQGEARLFLALGIGCVCCETTRAGVRWVTERYGAKGPLADLVSDMAEADDAVPFLGIAVLFAVGPQPAGAILPLPAWGGLLVTLVLGGVLGATASALADVEKRRTERWGILLGTALLNTGVAMRLNLSAPSAMFAMGISLNLFSRHGRDLRAMLAVTERPIVMPALVLAGAHLDLQDGGSMWGIVGLAVLARVAAKTLGGLATLRMSPAASRGSPLLGLSMLSSGSLTACVGLATALRFPGPVGRAVLATSIASAILGEIIGPAMLKRELGVAGEIQDAAQKTPIPESRVVAPDASTARRGRGGIVAARARSRTNMPKIDPRLSDPRISDARASDPRASDPRLSDPPAGLSSPPPPDVRRSDAPTVLSSPPPADEARGASDPLRGREGPEGSSA
jgi:hypothetical protein